MVGRKVSIINLLCNTKKKEISIDSLSIGIDNQNELELWIRFGLQGLDWFGFEDLLISEIDLRKGLLKY